ncbi:hypothetical protein VaNZ11_011715 [Volvox africanus]|uniref:DUF1232 domain-containing protein n=1 Tax=Volvox africanus TaxID=51714 RepID=A0ABQ5SCZ4_9CHLO|nr:hypothetical protein VaNZ11_011715 [Volvox africanus]
MAGGTTCKNSSLSSGVPVPGHIKRCVTFKNTPEVHLMTPDCTSPAFKGRGWTGANPYTQVNGDEPQQSSLPVAAPPCRSRIAGPYDSLAPIDSDETTSPQIVPAVPQRLSWYQRLKNAAKALKHEVLAVYYAMQHPQTPFLAKAIAFLVLAYALSPLDLIPDFIPVLGIVDDLILLPLLIAAAIALLPRGVMEESRRRAHEEPLRLARNWPMAVLIAALWVACLEWLMYWLVNRYGTPVMRQYLPYGMIGLGLVCAGGFAVWLVRRVRKERRKQKVAAAAAAKKTLEEAAAVAMATEAKGKVVVPVQDETEAGSGDLVEDIDVERGLQQKVAPGLPYQHAIRTTAGAAGLRQPLLFEQERGDEAEGAAADNDDGVTAAGWRLLWSSGQVPPLAYLPVQAT